MESMAFVMKIGPDKVKDYIDIHKIGNVWPEVLDNIYKSGINKMKIFMLDNNAIAYIESEDIKKAFDYLGNQRSQLKWNKETEGFMDTQPNYGSDKIVDELECVFNFENGKQIS